MSSPSYPGLELELFAQAVTWKRYFKRHLDPYLRGVVVEVGAGMGATTRTLCDGRQTRWICLEPDPTLFEGLRHSLSTLPAGGTPIDSRPGTLRDLTDVAPDVILYCDVLEHIEDDRAELEIAAAKLQPGGRIVVLSPAHQWLYSSFDRAIGHHRRYTARTLQRLTPTGLEPERFWYLDAMGVVASLANRSLLRQRMPTARQLQTWDRFLVPISRLIDPLLGLSPRQVGRCHLAEAGGAERVRGTIIPSPEAAKGDARASGVWPTRLARLSRAAPWAAAIAIGVG